jgi:peptidoglycan/LPS O-acetylase OafA/YrhL
MQHRRDIDGLRAVAVLPVILFHAGLPGLSGGWLGVDVFFVISGFLITQVLLEDHRKGHISLARFYERRARRILPALFVVLAVSTVVALLWLPPAGLASYAASLGLTGLFMSNLWFMTQTGYFANAAEVHPLIHTWSLAVEEQFYLIYPLLLMALLRLRAPLLPVLAGLGIASLGFAWWAQGPYPEQVFYFPVARAWELLAGACLALGGTEAKGGYGGDLGLALILGAMVMADPTNIAPFPGLAPLAATLGAGLILRLGAGRITRPLLEWRPAVGLGLVSYSAYLWHQPVLAFAQLRQIDPLPAGPQLALMLGLAALSIALGAVSWALVEQPVRLRRVAWLATRGKVFVAAGAGSLAVFLLGLALYLSGGLPMRVSPQVAEASTAAVFNPWRGRCDANQVGHLPQHPVAACTLPGTAPQIYLYGDSHAAMLWGPLLQALQARGQAGYVATMGGCPALPGLAVEGDPRAVTCDAFSRGALADMARRPKDTVIVLALRWALYVDGTRFDNGRGGVEAGEDRPVVPLTALANPPDEAPRRAQVLALMQQALDAIAKDHRLVLVYPIPEAGWSVPDRLARLGMFGQFPDRLSLPEPLATARAAPVEAMLDALDSPNIRRIRPRDLFCDGATCALNDGGTSLYADSNHLSAPGAARVVGAILDTLTP